MKVCEFNGLAESGAFAVTQIQFTLKCFCSSCMFLIFVEQNNYKTRFFHLQLSSDTRKSSYNTFWICTKVVSLSLCQLNDLSNNSLVVIDFFLMS